MTRLMRGDCFWGMRKLADASVNLILVDLPYGTTACKWDSVIPFEPMWENFFRVLTASGASHDPD